MPRLDPIIARFDPIALSEMDGVALQARMDTKFLFAASELPALLEVLSTEYRMLEVNGERGIGYRTLYFDTPDRRFYFEHHNGYTYRSKVRMREYVGTNACFLEVERRTGRGGTLKRRIPIPAISEHLTPGQAAFAASVSQCDTPLAPTLWNEFFRFTLVHHERAERLTLDIRPTFRDADGEAGLPQICVAELKEGRKGHGSPFLALMRKLPVPPTSFSKYCVGTVLLRPDIKYNQFKPILLRAERVSSAV